MSAQTRKHKIHGIEVEQVSYQGKWYTGVAARVQIAEQADPDDIRQDGHGYHVTRVEIIQMGDKWAYHCMVEYPIGSGVIRPGTDFIDLSDKAGIAKAETSAIGRALGLHGIASEEGIASAEEMRRSGVAPDDAPAQPPAQSSFASRPHPINASSETLALVHGGDLTPAAAAVAPKSGAASDEQRERMRQQRNLLRILDKTVERADNTLNGRQADERIRAYDQRLADRQREGARA